MSETEFVPQWYDYLLAFTLSGLAVIVVFGGLAFAFIALMEYTYTRRGGSNFETKGTLMWAFAERGVRNREYRKQLKNARSTARAVKILLEPETKEPAKLSRYQYWMNKKYGFYYDADMKRIETESSLKGMTMNQFIEDEINDWMK